MVNRFGLDAEYTIVLQVLTYGRDEQFLLRPQHYPYTVKTMPQDRLRAITNQMSTSNMTKRVLVCYCVDVDACAGWYDTLARLRLS